MSYDVLIGARAESDLEAIYDYVVLNGGVVQADRVLDRLMQVVASLRMQPQRGSHPRELAESGYSQYRQVVFKPWRVVYRVIGKQVVIYLIADGRRDMRSLLAQRLLNA